MSEKNKEMFAEADLTTPLSKEEEREVFISMRRQGVKPEDLPDPTDAKEYAAWLALDEDEDAEVEFDDDKIEDAE